MPGSSRVFPHRMLQEIYEQPSAVRDTAKLATLRTPDSPDWLLSFPTQDVQAVQRVLIAASGTSRHAGFAGKFMIEKLAGIPVEVDYSSEFQHAPLPPARDTLVVVITQSGETLDTLSALRRAKAAGAKVVAICNVADASVMREADAGIHTKAGPELAVPSTKAFSAQLAALLLLAFWLAEKRQSISAQTVDKLLAALTEIPTQMEFVLTLDSQIEALARKYSWCRDFFYAGRGIHHAIAMDGALKLKEVSYLHAEEFPTGEILHGPMAMVDDKIVVFVISTCDRSDAESIQRYDKTVANIKTIKSRRGNVIALVSADDHIISQLADDVLPIPAVTELLLPLLEIIPLQLFAYHLAVLQGRDVDQPRSLSKAVVSD
jgi:glutamine---fructose-6-phosphate transaminase (isomerizing)